ncbi:MAG: guanylate kinase [Lachnospiraceae bacterium]|nr:guanylate kinase [Lachnospiraceae bacterium]
MGKLIYLMGKSSSGKDTVYRELLRDPSLNFKKVVLYTTRPIREGETDGVQYHFVDDEVYLRFLGENKLIESRVYNTYHGLWRYFTVDDGSVDLSKDDYLIIGTLDSYEKTANYYGKDKVLPIYIEVDDGIRLERALSRERAQDNPRYEEMCRRFLADTADFSDARMEQAGITRRFNNEDLDGCLNEIKDYISENM